MSEGRLQRMDDDQLAGALRGLTPAWPATPALAPAVADRIRTGSARGPWRGGLAVSSRFRTVAIAVAVVLLLATAAVAAKLVIDIGAVTLKTVPGTPGPLPPESAAAFGDRVEDVAAAGDAAGFPASVPTSLRPPDRLWVATAVPEGGPETPIARIAMAWRAGPDLPAIGDLPWGGILLEFTGEANVASKTLYAQTGSIQAVRIDGSDGYWLVGPHTLTLLRSNGETVDLQVSGHVLIWQRGPRTFRLETALGLDEARGIASSVR